VLSSMELVSSISFALCFFTPVLLVFVNISEFRNCYQTEISFLERGSYGRGQAPGASVTIKRA
jgi:hypothetical protein